MSFGYFIDCGNSRSKIAHNDHAFTVTAVADADLVMWFEQATPGTCLLLPGNEARAQRCEAAAHAVGMHVERLRNQDQTISCGQYVGMGLDRLCAGIAAVQHCQSDVIVIDAGTMLTLSAWKFRARHDFSSCFVDGFIFPGAQVCLDAMHHAAPALPQLDVAVEGQTPTAQHMQRAVHHAWPAAVTALLQQLQAQLSTAQILVTGGSRPYLPVSLLENQHEHLVLRGMQLLTSV